MNTHILIVDSNTFQYHLEYLFFGTGAKDYRLDFNNTESSSLSFQAENMLVDLMADGMRVRKGDNIIFYLQQNFSAGIREGKFYGVFKAEEDGIFLDNYDLEDQYLLQELKKSLIFRCLIEPCEVYPEGVTEWEALDEIKNITVPYQMLWSLIYRKLKGNRGNTMITLYEAERLIQLIRNKNKTEPIDATKKLTFDKNSQQIQATSEKRNQYQGRKETINILPRLINKHSKKKAYETHLQAYIVQNIGNRNSPVQAIFANFPGYEISWFGNEVSCGVGMQRIDIVVELTKPIGIPHRLIIPIELKARRCQIEDIHQLSRYIAWLQQYYLPNRPGDIKPILIGELPISKEALANFTSELNRFNVHSSVKEIMFFASTFGEAGLSFELYEY